MNEESSAARRDVVLGSRVLAAHGNADMVWGHLSVRDPREPSTFWMKAAGYGLEEVSAERVVQVGEGGELLAGTGRLHLEYHIHAEILAARPDVGAVVHSHAESAIAFAACRTPLRAIGHEGTLFALPDIARFTETGDLIRTPELGRVLVSCLGDGNAVLLERHGLVAVGADVGTAVLTAIFLEKACRMQLTTMAATGTSFAASDAAEIAAKRDRCYGERQMNDAWAYLLRTTDWGVIQ